VTVVVAAVVMTAASVAVAVTGAIADTDNNRVEV